MLTLLCGIPYLAAHLALCAAETPLATGYVEGDYLHLAPIETARIEEIRVRRGDHVSAGDTVVVLDKRDAEIAVARATAERARAQSELADLQQGSREAEIRVAEATLASAEAELAEARRELERDRGLFDRGVLPQAGLDATRTKAEVMEARVAELKARLESMRLPARADRIAAAEASVRQRDAALAEAKWRLENRVLSVPTDGEVADVLRFPGELAGPQGPVLSILPQGAIKIKFYVPETDLSRMHRGRELRILCDGCEGDQRATVSYVSHEPEFTPPVIYSVEARQKLVYLVEATPNDGADRLRPGQIVDVVLDEAGQ